jgi:hypothetical protein
MQIFWAVRNTRILLRPRKSKRMRVKSWSQKAYGKSAQNVGRPLRKQKAVIIWYALVPSAKITIPREQNLTTKQEIELEARGTIDLLINLHTNIKRINTDVAYTFVLRVLLKCLNIKDLYV